MKYYALASSKDYPSLIVNISSDSRILAEKEADTICKSNNLRLEGVYRIQPFEKWGSIMTKNAQQRKLQRGLESKKKRNKIKG